MMHARVLSDALFDGQVLFIFSSELVKLEARPTISNIRLNFFKLTKLVPCQKRPVLA